MGRGLSAWIGVGLKKKEPLLTQPERRLKKKVRVTGVKKEKSETSSQIHHQMKTQQANHKGLWMSTTHLKLISKTSYMANRPQKTLHEGEVETSDLHRNVWTTP